MIMHNNQISPRTMALHIHIYIPELKGLKAKEIYIAQYNEGNANKQLFVCLE